MFKFSRFLSIINFSFIILGLFIIVIYTEYFMREIFWEKEWIKILKFLFIFLLIPTFLNIIFNWIIFRKLTVWVKYKKETKLFKK